MTHFGSWSRFVTDAQVLGLQSGLMSSATAVNKKNREFDPNTFLATIGAGRKNVAVAKKETIFAEGDGADAVFYIQSGKVKLTVVSQTGRERWAIVCATCDGAIL